MNKIRTKTARTRCKQTELNLTRVKGRRVRIDFKGGEVTSDAGLLLLREVDLKLGLSAKVAKLLVDRREPGKVRHQALTMLRQRLFALCAGYEDLNDFDQLGKDPLMQSVSGVTEPLASASTLCRFENQQGRQLAWQVHELLVDTFIASHRKAPAELVLDFDATDDAVHGRQQGCFFHGYYDHYCFLPLYVFCGQQLLVAYLRPSNIDASKQAAAILKLLVQRIRESWPQTRLIFRGDSGFCRPRILRWCEAHEVDYVVGIARNGRLLAQAKELSEKAREGYEQSECKQRLFESFAYGARSWGLKRRVIHKAEYNRRGPNDRFVVTTLEGPGQQIYDRRYCPRGEMENRIKEQMMLFSDRTSAQRWWANQWRLLLSALAYTLMERLRRLGLAGSQLARAQCHNLRVKLIKVGAVVVRNTRSVYFHMTQSYPYKELFMGVMGRLAPP